MSEEFGYMKLYNQLKEKIVNGSYHYGEKLPSKRTLASDQNVSVITVQHTYQLLSDEGYIEARERSGYFVIYREGDFLGSTHTTTTTEPIATAPAHHSIGEFSFNILSRTMHKVLLDYGNQILVKSPSQGCVELRKEISNYLAKQRGIYVPINQIVIGSGAEYLYSLVAQLFPREDCFAIENPCYDKIPKVYEALGHPVEPLTLQADGIYTKELENTRARLLHVTPFHSYPSNVSVGISKKLEYLQWATNGRYLVEDNYDSELSISSKMEDALFALSEEDNVIYINTFSKTIAPSMRIGYMLLPQSLTTPFTEKLGFYSCTVPVFEQLVISELLRSGDYERHINRERRRRRKELK